MKCSAYTDEELRRLLVAQPDDADTVAEAAARFLAQQSAAEIEDERQRAYEEGYEDGHAEGYDDGYATTRYED